jgi:hypothetical protein
MHGQSPFQTDLRRRVVDTTVVPSSCRAFGVSASSAIRQGRSERPARLSRGCRAATGVRSGLRRIRQKPANAFGLKLATADLGPTRSGERHGTDANQ